MITAAAKLKLDNRQLAIFEGILIKLIKPAMRARDKLAHWCWGYLPQISGVLLLMQPDEKTLIHVRHLHPPSPVVFGKSKIFVIKEPDIERILGQIVFVTDRLADFTAALQKYNAQQVRDVLLEKLSREPRIREYLDRRKANQETPPSNHEQSPTEDASG
jgi:hypothetical protein